MYHIVYTVSKRINPHYKNFMPMIFSGKNVYKQNKRQYIKNYFWLKTQIVKSIENHIFKKRYWCYIFLKMLFKKTTVIYRKSQKKNCYCIFDNNNCNFITS